MKISSFAITSIFVVLISSCSSSKKITSSKLAVIGSLQLIDVYVVPYDLQFKGTTVGGLSSIDYDAKRDRYYMICDDRSDKNPARFYTAAIKFTGKKIDTVAFTDVTTWKDKNGNDYPSRNTDPFHTPDPESMRYDASRDQLVWSSEGERVVKPGTMTVLEDPAVTITDINGKFKDSFALPSNMRMTTIEKGPRQNSVFEGTTFSPDHKYLFVSVEEPLYEDGPRAGTGDSTAWVRLIKFDATTKKQVAQYAYQLSPVAYPPNPAGGFKLNGISEILYAGNDQLLVMERSYSKGQLKNTIRIYLSDMRNASDISAVASIPAQKGIRPVTKKLLLNMNDLGIYIDNVEGLTFGPVLPDGGRTLLFVADNNFDIEQKTQFFLFRVLP